jgi:hypothetical protein
MTGEARIIFGVILIIVGLPFLLVFLIGLPVIAAGVILLVWGVSAREEEQRMRNQQLHAHLLLQQQMQLAAIHHNPVQYSYGASPPTYGAPAPLYPPPPPAPGLLPPPSPPVHSGYTQPPDPGRAGGFCPFCGSAVAVSHAYCQKCGRPIPV